jgi:hypothetical protein
MTRVPMVAVCLVLPSTGCMTNTYSSDPNRRIEELINQSEDLRTIELEVERFWKDDQPTHLTPERIPGGIPDEAPRSQVTVANVHKEPVTVFAVVDGRLTFLRQIPAGEAVDLIPPPGGRLAATFSAAPHCANYHAKGTTGEVWLLRPALEVRPTTCGPTMPI